MSDFSTRATPSRVPPPLPPRQSSFSDPPPAYESIVHTESFLSRTSSRPDTGSPSRSDGRRKLVLVYIHGFMGTETSFRSFPTHVHNVLTALLSETHLIETKIYRYKSRDALTAACKTLASWLAPFNRDSNTDVVLLAHSMGGLLAADVAVLPPPFKAPLAVVNFDVPFLGMHPRVVRSGLASIFNPADDPRDRWQEGDLDHSTPSSASLNSTNSNPLGTPWDMSMYSSNISTSFMNNSRPSGQGGWADVWKFVVSNKRDLWKASKGLASAHWAFGGAMANYSDLAARYTRIRALEESDPSIRQLLLKQNHGRPPPRVRFLNYFTSCTGRPKKAGKENEVDNHEKDDIEQPATSLVNATDPLDDSDIETAAETLTIGELSDFDPNESLSDSSLSQDLADPLESPSDPGNLPPLPAPPPAPPSLDLSGVENRDARALLIREHKRAIRAYKLAMRDYKLAVRDRKRLKQRIRRREERQVATERRKEKRAIRGKEKDKGKHKLDKMNSQHRAEDDRHTEASTVLFDQSNMADETEVSVPPDSEARDSNPLASLGEEAHSIGKQMDHWLDDSASATSVAPSYHSTDAPILQKERTFCVLPPRDANGLLDPCWVRVSMKDVDEVGAHCGLFFLDERYERLVGEVAQRIEQWANETLPTLAKALQLS